MFELNFVNFPAASSNLLIHLSFECLITSPLLLASRSFRYLPKAERQQNLSLFVHSPPPAVFTVPPQISTSSGSIPRFNSVYLLR